MQEIQNIKSIDPLKIASTKANIEITRAGINTTQTDHSLKYKTILPSRIPNMIAYLHKKTKISRKTLFDILHQSNRLEEFMKNPYPFMENILECYL